MDKRRNLPPSIIESVFAKILLLTGFASVVYFAQWFFNPQFRGNGYLYAIVVATFAYKILVRFIEWYQCIHLSVKKKPEGTKVWTVDVLTTFCPGEPKEMIKETLEAIQKITYPHKSFLCDEANDPELKELCKKLDVVHVTRVEKVNAKAGNINNALHTVASGDICLILDPDHVPYPDFLDEVLPYFEDEKVGFVQVVQAYYNQDSTVIAKAAAQQTYQFYGPFMMGLNSLDAVPAIGANCTFRRKALDSIGGHAPGLTEDMHTAMLLHAKGWKSIYNPVVVAKGLVPWNYSGYCLQQLKWARGSFGLLFKVLPKIMLKLKLSQLAYYLSVPFFYLFGLFAFFDFAIPIVSLFSGLIPIKVTIFEFVKYFLPFFVVSFLIRQFNQRWLYEDQEKGAFLLGGTLFKAAWWTSLLGFFYSLIRKKVPYIPTPKNQDYETPIKLLIPNFTIIIFSITAIVYGLFRDTNPFSIFMAVLAFLNVLVLGFGSFMAMQHVIVSLHTYMKGSFISKGSKSRIAINKVKVFLFSEIQFYALPIFIICVILGYVFHKKEVQNIKNLKTEIWELKQKFVPNISGTGVANYDSLSDFIFDTVHLSDHFYDDAIRLYELARQNNAFPYYVLSVDSILSHTFFLELANNQIRPFIQKAREYYTPIFISVISQNDTIVRADVASYYMLSINGIANEELFPNIAWVWQVTSDEEMQLGHSMKLTSSWFLTDSIHLNTVLDNFPHMPVFVKNAHSITATNASVDQAMGYDVSIFESQKIKPISRRTMDTYVKGVAYNPGHDWRDNDKSMPLTLEKLRYDFSKIKEMGANTVRRYSFSMYDKNILAVANEYDLDVLYGFWFDNKIDYWLDKKSRATFADEVLSFVRKHKDDTRILSWTIGNETWGLLKNKFTEPHLSYVRMGYLQMISSIACKIKEIDTIHPIMIAEEHSEYLGCGLYAFSRYVPAVDVYGINSYYDTNISMLDTIVQMAVGDAPYLVSEFGPKGYWQVENNSFDANGRLLEQSSFEKAESFSFQWENYIAGKKGRNVGGVAFCWQDRFEGTATWFGITDIYGNSKPSWYALSHVFSGNDTVFPIEPFHIITEPVCHPFGQSVAVAATNNVHLRSNYYYKWMIYKENTFEKVEETDFEQGAFSFSFEVPTEKDQYRIYLYVRDSNGHSVTESKPLIIAWSE